MTSGVLLTLYALSAWGAFLNCPAWFRLLLRRLREPGRPLRLRDDGFVFVRAGLTFLSLGIVSLAGARIWGALFEGSPITVPSAAGIIGIASMALAEPMFLRVDEIHARAIGKHSRLWRTYWLGIAGAAAVALWRMAV